MAAVDSGKVFEKKVGNFRTLRVVDEKSFYRRVSGLAVGKDFRIARQQSGGAVFAAQLVPARAVFFDFTGLKKRLRADKYR